VCVCVCVFDGGGCFDENNADRRHRQSKGIIHGRIKTFE